VRDKGDQVAGLVIGPRAWHVRYSPRAGNLFTPITVRCWGVKPTLCRHGFLSVRAGRALAGAEKRRLPTSSIGSLPAPAEAYPSVLAAFCLERVPLIEIEGKFRFRFAAMGPSAKASSASLGHTKGAPRSHFDFRVKGLMSGTVLIGCGQLWELTMAASGKPSALKRDQIATAVTSADFPDGATLKRALAALKRGPIRFPNGLRACGQYCRG
jgi:hypothetical protein